MKTRKTINLPLKISSSPINTTAQTKIVCKYLGLANVGKSLSGIVEPQISRQYPNSLLSSMLPRNPTIFYSDSVLQLDAKPLQNITNTVTLRRNVVTPIFHLIYIYMLIPTVFANLLVSKKHYYSPPSPDHNIQVVAP